VLKTNNVQLKKINIDKWNEGCRIQKDPGQEFVIEWIDKNAAWFRQAWNQSLCQLCQNSHFCGYRVTQECDEFVPE
jgi:hypothetical protein